MLQQQSEADQGESEGQFTPSLHCTRSHEVICPYFRYICQCQTLLLQCGGFSGQIYGIYFSEHNHRSVSIYFCFLVFGDKYRRMWMNVVKNRSFPEEIVTHSTSRHKTSLNERRLSRFKKGFL